jgi:carbon storage regulator
MLVLARKVGQSIVINDNIELLVIEVRGDQVRIGIEAPRSIPVHRKELLEQIRAENAKAAGDVEIDVVARVLGSTAEPPPEVSQ